MEFEGFEMDDKFLYTVYITMQTKGSNITDNCTLTERTQRMDLWMFRLFVSSPLGRFAPRRFARWCLVFYWISRKRWIHPGTKKIGSEMTA